MQRHCAPRAGMCSRSVALLVPTVQGCAGGPVGLSGNPCQLRRSNRHHTPPQHKTGHLFLLLSLLLGGKKMYSYKNHFPNRG